MRNKSIFILILVTFVALVLRFYAIGVNPPELTWDEVAWGYNAYALGIDGRDEFGRFIPLDYLESFGDFKPPLYAYLSILPVKLFGLNAFATRFASAFFGTLTIVVTYFLVQELLKGTKPSKESPSLNISLLGLISAGVLALSPWHINLSRAAFEANVASFFITTGVWLFLRAIHWNKRLLILSCLSFVLSLYTFNTARIVTPLLILALSLGFYKQLFKNKRIVLVSACIGMVLSLPFLEFMLTPQAKLRYHEVNIFSDLSVIERTNEAMEYDRQSVRSDAIPIWSRIIHNRRLAYAIQYVKHYLDHFNPSFLFIKGDGNPKLSTQDVGQFYLWDIPFLIIGTLFLFRYKPGYWWIIPVWLLLGIVPAATARETPHALRIEAILPIPHIVIAFGILITISFLRKNISRKLYYSLGGVIVFLLIMNVSYYLHGYYRHYPYNYSGEWQYGYKDAIAYIQSVENEYDTIVFTTALGRPYIYALFYTKENPSFFRQTATVEREVFGFVHVNGYGKYIFTRNPSSYQPNGRVLYIAKSDEARENAQVVKTIPLLNGDPGLTIYTK